MQKSLLVIIPALLVAACGDRAGSSDTMAAMGGDSTGQMAAPMDSAGGAMLDPNTATSEQLMAAGLDSAAAAALVAGRPYDNMTAVNGALPSSMDSTRRAALYARVWKPLDLNTASDEEILLIPGLGRRMLHEFKEYRPYTNIAQFRREIGKYVDDAEVARLEKYVTIR